ncbi:MAG TPA: NADH:flavin oxidoreductase/NADH oxidase [Burkholderiales bacterium]|nr:NADH:flavin oxidoreductase/NADH oxidase [Burkholderiales bacterium]
MATTPLLFSPLTLRGVTLKNRVVISPMCQYSARNGFADDWHFVHLGKMATGGAGLIFTEAAAIEPEGRITHGDLGIWSDDHIAPLKRITDFIKANGSVPAIQLAHAGRKASMQRPWHGNGPINDSDRARGEDTWRTIAPSAIAMDTGWLVPHELSVEDIRNVQGRWRDAAVRSLRAGFDVIEMHSAHGYLGHEFLSPISNKRTDGYGGSLQGRMRYTLELAEVLRKAWPLDKPLFVRISSVDGIEGGWAIEDSIILAKELAARGVDVVDCSSGGLLGSATAARIKRNPGFQVPFADRLRKETGIKTMAVGLILDGPQAEQILKDAQADLIAIGRQSLYNPNWALHAQVALGAQGEYADWPVQYGWWLDKRQHILADDVKQKIA